MAYSAVAQGEHPGSPGAAPSPILSSSDGRPLSIEPGGLGGGVAVDSATGHAALCSSRLGPLIRSITSTRPTYDMVEDDDYEAPQVEPLGVWKHGDESASAPTRARDPQWPSHSSSPKRTVPYRTASISRDTPL